MTDSARGMPDDRTDARPGIARKRPDADAQYPDQRRRPEKVRRLTVRRHCEGETVKAIFEQNEAYIRGLRDSVKLPAFPGVFSAEAGL